jgi:predicted O-methyltransferase YrrM
LQNLERERESIASTLAEKNDGSVITFKRLPGKILVPTAAKPIQGVYKKQYRFRQGTDFYFSTRHPLIWEKALANYKGKPGIHYLEIGVFEGQSFLWMLDNVLTHPTARAVGIDPFIDDYKFSPEKTPYKDVFLSNLRLSGSEGKASIRQGFSQIELRKLPLDSFDVIYVDGSHEAADVLEDAVLCWRLLREGGTLIFDDYLLDDNGDQPGPAIDAFNAFFGKQFEVVHADWQVILKKKTKKGDAARI